MQAETNLAETLPPSAPRSASSTTVSKLLNVLACPEDVFEEVAGAPHRPVNWLLPTVLLALANTVLLGFLETSDSISAIVTQQVAAAGLPGTQADASTSNWHMASVLATWVSAFGGVFWSAFLLWLMGRFFLRVSFSYWKALEIAGLTVVISVLATAVTILLVVASGEPGARPSLAGLAGPLAHGGLRWGILELMNPFYLWTIILLALGLSRLGAVTLKESAFWVFGYWLVVRVALIVLA